MRGPNFQNTKETFKLVPMIQRPMTVVVNQPAAIATPSDHVPILLTSESLMPRRALLSLSANLLRLNSSVKTKTPTSMDPAYETPHQRVDRFKDLLRSLDTEPAHQLAGLTMTEYLNKRKAGSPPFMASKVPSTTCCNPKPSNLGILGEALLLPLEVSPDRPSLQMMLRDSTMFNGTPSSEDSLPTSANVASAISAKRAMMDRTYDDMTIGLPPYWTPLSISLLSGAAWFVQQQAQERIIRERDRIRKTIHHDPKTRMVTTPDGVVMSENAFLLQYRTIDLWVDAQIKWIDLRNQPCTFKQYILSLCWLNNCDPDEFDFLKETKMCDDEDYGFGRKEHPTDDVTRKMGWFAACFITLGVILAIAAIAFLK